MVKAENRGLQIKNLSGDHTGSLIHSLFSVGSVPSQK